MELVPVGEKERIPLLDVLRGFAMFGVLWSNLNDSYGTVAASSSLQHALAWTQQWLIESRFYSLLGFLFGIGFAIQLTRAEERGGDVRAMFWRRMAALLGIGIVHGMLIWRGDVLIEYALLGLILVFCRRLSPRALLAVAAAGLVLAPYLINAGVVGFGVRFPQRPPSAEANWIYAHGSTWQIVAEGARGYLFWYRRWPLFVFPTFFALFTLGMWSVRVDLLKRLTARRGSLFWVLAAAVVTMLFCVYVQTHLGQWWPVGPPRRTLAEALFSTRPLRGRIDSLANTLSLWSNAAAYAAVLALLVSVPACARRLKPLAAAGRMSLTTYLTQSLVSVTLFYNYGFGWYGRVGYDGMLAIAVTVFALQMAASVWWLRRFRFGPMEWLWRSAAYGKLQPMRLETEPRLAAAVSSV